MRFPIFPSFRGTTRFFCRSGQNKRIQKSVSKPARKRRRAKNPADPWHSVRVAIFQESETMTFQIEVTADHSERFYELSAESFLSLEKVFLSHSQTKSLRVAVQNVSGTRPKRIQAVNLSSFRCLKKLEFLSIEMNDVATITCDNPFFFQLRHLSLSRCQMTFYDFCILMNCVADSLESLELHQVSLMDSECSANVSLILSELCRLSNLKSLKIDRTWAEFQKDAKNFSCSKLQSLTLQKVQFEDLFSTELRRFTSCLMCESIIVEGKEYKLTDLPELLGKFHHFAATTWSTMKFGMKPSRFPGRRKPKLDAKTQFCFVLGWPKIHFGEHVLDVVDRLEEVFAFESLKVLVPARINPRSRFSPVGSPAMSPVASSEDEDTFVTAFDSLTQVSAAS
uniref:Uncharacterized protein n=2 Tax=Panagrolaimus sp. JU765 TaxID=591449 RepID=A0AC34RG68_9BILA